MHGSCTEAEQYILKPSSVRKLPNNPKPQTNRPVECEELEKRILSAGRSMLKNVRVGDMIFSLHFISRYLAERDHLLVRSAMFLVKAFIVYRVSGVSGECIG